MPKFVFAGAPKRVTLNPPAVLESNIPVAVLLLVTPNPPDDGAVAYPPKPPDVKLDPNDALVEEGCPSMLLGKAAPAVTFGELPNIIPIDCCCCCAPNPPAVVVLIGVFAKPPPNGDCCCCCC